MSTKPSEVLEDRKPAGGRRKDVVMRGTVRVSEEILQSCRVIAKAEGRTLSGLIDMWLRMRLKERSKVNGDKNATSGGYRT